MLRHPSHAGKKIASEYLALGVFAAYGTLAYTMTGGGDKKAAASSGSGSAKDSVPTPPLNASSS